MSWLTPRTGDMPTGPHEAVGPANKGRAWHNAWLRLERGFRSKACACRLETDHWEETTDGVG